VEIFKAIEKMLGEGLIKELYDEKTGELKYELTMKGKHITFETLRRNVDAFNYVFNTIVVAAVSRNLPIRVVLEFLLFFIYRVHYELPEEHAVKLAKEWFEEEEAEM